MYVVCALLQNAHACIYGNIMSSVFELPPPSLEQYYSIRREQFFEHGLNKLILSKCSIYNLFCLKVNKCLHSK